MMGVYSNCIHVVDDDRVICHSISRVLSKHGYDVEVFGSGEQYLESLIDGYDGYLLLDYKMRGMSGLELQEILLEKNVHPRVIFITAMGELIQKQALANGAVKVFDKPFDLKELIDIL
jgi:FixJ family two-component response regulator